MSQFKGHLSVVRGETMTGEKANINLLIVGKCKFQDLWLNGDVYREWLALAQHEFDCFHCVTSSVLSR